VVQAGRAEPTGRAEPSRISRARLGSWACRARLVKVKIHITLIIFGLLEKKIEEK